MALTNVERESVPRKTMIVFFLVDTSGGMLGAKMASVNLAIEQTLEKLREMNADYSADAVIEVAFLEFSSGARWLTPNWPMKVDCYYWSDLEADGLSMMGEAFRMLNEKLSTRSGFMNRASGSFAPCIFLLSDGEPTDDYKYHLEKLKQNHWFRVAIKVALAVGDDANDMVLQEFTGSKEGLVRVPDGKNAGEKLAKKVLFQYPDDDYDYFDSGWLYRNKSKEEYVNAQILNALSDEDDDWDIDASSDGIDWDNKKEKPMPLTKLEREAVPRKSMALFFIIGTGGSMHGPRIGAVNSAIEQTLEKLLEMNADNADAEIEVAFLEYSNGARWLTPNGPMKVDNYYWSDLDADGAHDMGEAFKMLREKLSVSNGFMRRASGSFAPVLFLISDSEPTDDYRKHLAKLKANGWYQAAIKVALAIGNDANDAVLQEFTGNKEGLVRVPDGKNAGEKLAKMVQFIAVTSSQIVSGSVDINEETKLKQAEVDETAQTFLSDDVLETLVSLKEKYGVQVFQNPDRFYELFNANVQDNVSNKAIARLLRDSIAEFDAFTVLFEAKKADEVLIDKICDEMLIDRTHAEKAVGYLAHIAGYKEI